MEGVDDGDARWFCPTCAARKVSLVYFMYQLIIAINHSTRLENLLRHYYHLLFNNYKYRFPLNFSCRKI